MEVFLKEIYVSPDGDDNNKGTIESPFKTLYKARNFARKNGDKNGYSVVLREGVYEMDRTFELSLFDKADGENPNVYTAYKDEKVSITGGKRLGFDEFKKVSDEKILARLPEAARGNVYEIDLGKKNINSGTLKQNGHALPVKVAALDLFVDGKAMQLARYPDNDYLEIGNVIDSGSVPRKGDYSERGGIFEYTDEIIDRLEGVKDAWVKGTFNNGYADDTMKIESVDAQKKQIKLAMPHLYGLDKEHHFKFQHYFIYNALELLDTPGEWYLDRDTGILYMWPLENAGQSDIVVSVLEEPVIAIENTKNIIFKNITVEAGRSIGIYMENTENCIIEGCTIRDTGNCGIMLGKGAVQTFPHNTHDDFEGYECSRMMGNLQQYMYHNTLWERGGGHDNKIIGCHIYNTGSGGVLVSGGSKKNLTDGNNEVINCRIHDYTRQNKFGWGGVNLDGCGNKIKNCEIYNSDMFAIYSRGNNHIVEYNNIHDVLKNVDDCGAFYMGRDPSDRGIKILHNYFHDIGNEGRRNMCIYLDDLSCGAEISKNVFKNVNTNRGLVFSNAGQDIKVTNNIAIDCPVVFVEISSFLYTWGRFTWPMYIGENGEINKKLKNVGYNKPPYSDAYPELCDVLEPIEGTGNETEETEYVFMRPRRNILKGNVIYKSEKFRKISDEALKYDEQGNLMVQHDCTRYGDKLLLRGPYAQFENIDNYEFNEDIGFINAQSYTLKDDSVVFEKIPYFENIKFEEIGLIK